MFRTIALTGFAVLVAATTISLAPPARAQIGNIFSDPPLRPPGAIPRGNQPPQQQPDDDEEVPELPRGRLLPTPNRPPPGQGVPAPGSVQTQPLAPPPGTTGVPQNTQPGIAVAPPQPGGPGPGTANGPPAANGSHSRKHSRHMLDILPHPALAASRELPFHCPLPAPIACPCSVISFHPTRNVGELT